MSDELPLAERVERYRTRNPNADVPEIAGALGESPATVRDVLDAESAETGKDSSKDTGDRVRGSRSRPRTDPDDDPVTRFSAWAGGDFEAPVPGVYPTDMHEREQWMGHSEKKPFAPWGDRDHPDADAEEDARWKWGIADNYVDGPTVAMAEDDPRLDGRAFLQQDSDPYVYVDGDDVRCPETGAVHPAFVAALEHLGLTYADISQSGAGVHAIYRGDLPDGVTQAKWQLDDTSWGDNEDTPSIEIYAGKRVCVMTGDHVPGTPTEAREWNDDILDTLLEANDDVAAAHRDCETDVSTDRGDYDLDDHDATATSSDETTADIRDVFAALDRLDAQRVADRTIVARWNDHASTSDGERAFWPTWGSVSSDSGTANIVNSERWLDTGDMGGYGGPVVMALIDAGEMQPSRASPKRATGERWWRGIEHLRDLGFDIPEYESSDPTVPSSTSAGGRPPEPETCPPPAVNIQPFDREERWREFQEDRYDDVVDADGPIIWADHAGAGKTTNAARAAAQRDRAFAVLFDKHEKAREFLLDEATPDIDFHLKGGAQKRHGTCMDADHADEPCPDHPGGGCPHMCPIYDLDPDEEARQRYEAVVEEVGPVTAHMILDLPHHDDGRCAWVDQFDELEHADRVVGVHEYQVLKTVRDGRDVIVDESPSALTTERSVGVEGIARAANALDALADLPPTPDDLAEFGRFARDAMDALAGESTADDLADLEPPAVEAETYYETVDPEDLPTDVDPDDVEERTVRESVGLEGTKYRTRTKHVVERSVLAEDLATLKIAYNESIVRRMRNDTWEGAPLCFDALLAAAAQAGLDEDAARQAIAVPTLLEHCPWCGSDVEYDDGARHCTADSCDWHEADHNITRKGGEQARACAWLDDGPAALNYAALPLASDLPDDPLVLDATATPAKVAALYDVSRDCVAVAGDELLEANLHVTQVLDGQYHAGTIRQALEDDRTLAERIQRTLDTVGDLHQRPLIVGKQDLLRQFDIPDNAETLHYHAARGLNRAECDAVVCIGAPHPDVEDLERQADLLAQGHSDQRVGGEEYSTRQDANPPVWRKLLYEDDAGEGRAVATKDFSGLVGDLWRETRENELEQVVHRIRPLLADQTKHAYLLTNVPTELPVDDLATFADLADPIEALLPVPEGAVDLLEATRDAVAGDGPDGFRAGSLVEQRDDGTVANKVAGYHRLAQLSGLDVSERTVYNWVHALEDVGLLTPEEYEQQAGVSYSTDFDTLQSALSILSSNGGFKLAAVRRLRQLLAEANGGLAWLEYARDLINVHGDPEVSGALRDDGGGPPA